MVDSKWLSLCSMKKIYSSIFSILILKQELNIFSYLISNKILLEKGDLMAYRNTYIFYIWKDITRMCFTSRKYLHRNWNQMQRKKRQHQFHGKKKKLNEKGSSWISTWFYYRHKPGAEKHKLNLYAHTNLKYFAQCFFRSHSQTCFPQTKPLR